MITHKELEDFLLEFDGAWLDYPFGKDFAVYKIRSKNETSKDKMSLNLQTKYESVLPGYHLNKKHWITIICSGQLTESEIKDLIRLSYRLVNDSK